MGKNHGNGTVSEDKENHKKSKAKSMEESGEEEDRDSKKHRKRVSHSSISESESYSDSESERESRRKEKRKRSKSSKRRSRSYDDTESSESSESESESDSESESESESERERERRKRRERKRRREKEEERERKRRKKEKEKKRKKKERKEEKKKEKLERGKKGAVTNSWGKYGVIRETDMWNKRPEFTAWLAEVKQVNLESLPNWEEKQMFKEFMEDHNTATFPSKKYYNLDAYHNRQMEKQMKKGFKKVQETERTVFNDEEQRRLEMMREREKLKEQEVEVLKKSMQSGMAQAMKEQALLKEEMAYQYKLGNFEAAAAIQRRLDPDVPM